MNIKFRSEFEAKNKNIISYNDRIILIGSCFSDNIGAKLSKYRFNSHSNPFGVMYNPESIKNTLSTIIKNYKFKTEDIEHCNGNYYSFFHHSSFNKSTEDEFIKNVNHKTKEAHNFLKKTNTAIITLGTAWIYKHINKDIIVSNCHKVPASEFSRKLLSVNEASNSLTEICNMLRSINNKMKIIFTLSPVRHLKDGFGGNSLSKSILRCAIENTINEFENTDYFEAYEIVNDDLRDYRFYKADLVHPNDIAVDYIWNKFSEACFSEKTVALMKRVSKINSSLEHRVFNKDSLQYKKFIESTINKIENLSNEAPYIDFSESLEYLKNQLKI